jgi:hypothetical protein
MGRGRGPRAGPGVGAKVGGTLVHPTARRPPAAACPPGPGPCGVTACSSAPSAPLSGPGPPSASSQPGPLDVGYSWAPPRPRRAAARPRATPGVLNRASSRPRRPSYQAGRPPGRGSDMRGRAPASGVGRCLAPARLALVLGMVSLSSRGADAAPDRWCVVDARVNRGGTGRVGGDVTVPLAAKLEPTAVGAISGYMTIVFPTGEGGAAAAAGRRGGQRWRRRARTLRWRALAAGGVRWRRRRAAPRRPRPPLARLRPHSAGRPARRAAAAGAAAGSGQAHATTSLVGPNRPCPPLPPRQTHAPLPRASRRRCRPRSSPSPPATPPRRSRWTALAPGPWWTPASWAPSKSPTTRQGGPNAAPRGGRWKAGGPMRAAGPEGSAPPGTGGRAPMRRRRRRSGCCSARRASTPRRWLGSPDPPPPPHPAPPHPRRPSSGPQGRLAPAATLPSSCATWGALPPSRATSWRSPPSA